MYGEFAIRVKNATEPDIDGKNDGYIDYGSSSDIESLKIEFDKWKTYTVDISGFGNACTEFAFVIPAGNTIYFKGLSVE